jgi:hypothetical protein
MTTIIIKKSGDDSWQKKGTGDNSNDGRKKTLKTETTQKRRIPTHGQPPKIRQIMSQNGQYD